MADSTVVASGSVDTAFYRKIQDNRWIVGVDGLAQYVFYTDLTGRPAFQVTPNGGVFWIGPFLAPGAGTDAKAISVWPDWQTLGHPQRLVNFFAIVDGGTKLYFNQMDIKDSSWIFPSGILVKIGLTSVDQSAFVSGCRAGNGVLGFAYNADGGTERGFLTSKDGIVWTEQANPIEAARDLFMLFPDGSGGEFRLLHWDASASQITYKHYDPVTNTWDTETTIASSMTLPVNFDSYGPQWGAAMRKDGTIFLAAWSAFDTSAADLNFYEIPGNAVTPRTLTSLITNTDDVAQAAVSIDNNSGKMKVFYLGKADGSQTIATLGDAVSVCAKSSNDLGQTWEAEEVISENAPAGHACVGASPGGLTGSFRPVWMTEPDIMTNLNTIEHYTLAEVGMPHLIWQRLSTVAVS